MCITLRWLIKVKLQYISWFRFFGGILNLVALTPGEIRFRAPCLRGKRRTGLFSNENFHSIFPFFFFLRGKHYMRLDFFNTNYDWTGQAHYTGEEEWGQGMETGSVRRDF